MKQATATVKRFEQNAYSSVYNLSKKLFYIILSTYIYFAVSMIDTSVAIKLELGFPTEFEYTVPEEILVFLYCWFL